MVATVVGFEALVCNRHISAAKQTLSAPEEQQKQYDVRYIKGL